MYLKAARQLLLIQPKQLNTEKQYIDRLLKCIASFVRVVYFILYTSIYVSNKIIWLLQ